LEVGNLEEAQRFIRSARPILDEFKVSSPSLLVLRDMGRCYESVGNVHRQIAENSSSVSSPERKAAETEARRWYRKSADAWNEWNRRGVATPESELEQHKVERYLESS